MAKNEPIGTVECPVKGCTEQCSVFRYRERGDSPKSIANRRLAGKLYARCTRHGRFDEGGPDMQEYILGNAKMHAPGAAGDRQPAPAKPPAKRPTRSPATPSNGSAAAPASSPAKRPGFWDGIWE